MTSYFIGVATARMLSGKRTGNSPTAPTPEFPLYQDSFTRAFGDGSRNLEPWSSDEAPSPNYHTTPTEGRLSS
ncbi:hypothetical protein TNCV_3493451 [Trichonephila clavipes]|nr:hypothetical protein TNCV_3493451 [Trichonephila clavipes]